MSAQAPQDLWQLISGQIVPKILYWWQPADPPLPFFKRLGWSFMSAAFGIMYTAVKRLFFEGAAQNLAERLLLEEYPALLAVILTIAGVVVSLVLAGIISSTHKSGNPIRLFLETILLLVVAVCVLDFL